MINNLSVLFIFTFTSCATFIDRPKHVKVSSFEKASQCPEIYKVYVERNIDYFLGEKNIFKCNLSMNDKDTSSCKKQMDFSMDWMVSENTFSSQHKELIKKLNNTEVCVQTVAKGKASYEVSIKTLSKEDDSLLWAFASGASLGIVPFRAEFSVKNEYIVTRLKDGKQLKYKSEHNITFWLQLFLLPVQFFIGDGPAHDKMIIHNQELLYEKIKSL